MWQLNLRSMWLWAWRYVKTKYFPETLQGSGMTEISSWNSHRSLLKSSNYQQILAKLCIPGPISAQEKQAGHIYKTIYIHIYILAKSLHATRSYQSYENWLAGGHSDILAKNMALTSPNWPDNLNCCVFQTRGWQHTSSLDVFRLLCFLMSSAQ